MKLFGKYGGEVDPASPVRLVAFPAFRQIVQCGRPCSVGRELCQGQPLAIALRGRLLTHGGHDGVLLGASDGSGAVVPRSVDGVKRPRGFAVPLCVYYQSSGVHCCALDSPRSVRERRDALDAPADQRYLAVRWGGFGASVLPSRRTGRPFVLHQVPGSQLGSLE